MVAEIRRIRSGNFTLILDDLCDLSSCLFKFDDLYTSNDEKWYQMGGHEKLAQCEDGLRVDHYTLQKLVQVCKVISYAGWENLFHFYATMHTSATNMQKLNFIYRYKFYYIQIFWFWETYMMIFGWKKEAINPLQVKWL